MRCCNLCLKTAVFVNCLGFAFSQQTTKEILTSNLSSTKSASFSTLLGKEVDTEVDNTENSENDHSKHDDVDPNTFSVFSRAAF